VETLKEGRVFFFEKKKQKTFGHGACPEGREPDTGGV
jgi:hypothetical protein